MGYEEKDDGDVQVGDTGMGINRELGGEDGVIQCMKFSNNN